ncbi:MAG: hypothetical protein ABIH67_01180 [Candidatus Uhrbacteria bacterium]
MKKISLKPNQIITLNDYPVYSDNVLCEYFQKCKAEENVPLVPVIKKDIVVKHLGEVILQIFNKFEKSNPTAEYFMLDGTHRTTALNLSGCKIEVINLEKDEDLHEAKQFISTGQVQKDSIWDFSLIENFELLNKHFQEKPYFMTVEQKTKKMIEEEILPDSLRDICLEN